MHLVLQLENLDETSPLGVATVMHYHMLMIRHGLIWYGLVWVDPSLCLTIYCTCVPGDPMPFHLPHENKVYV